MTTKLTREKIQEGDTLERLVSGFFPSPNKIFEQGISTNPLVTYLYLCRCGNNDSDAFPGYGDIGVKCGFSKRTAIRSVNWLTDAGWLIKRKIYNQKTKRHFSNRYTIFLPPSDTQTLGSDTQSLGSDTLTPYKEPRNNNYLKKNNKNIENRFMDTSKFNSPENTDLFQR